ncbi:hypothetical protein J2125_003524 [Erwinia toletana]|uniref:Uncharacterized protein n=1 Tax=Winslowiella toletana TaxID=92490 RepID=A0ABS4PDR4_9GAMM|nr:hypothetical protein [Winslowiella toletana]MBP2170332.1 hypothetical protein [Winslowiella toletana]
MDPTHSKLVPFVKPTCLATDSQPAKSNPMSVPTAYNVPNTLETLKSVVTLNQQSESDRSLQKYMPNPPSLPQLPADFHSPQLPQFIQIADHDSKKIQQFSSTADASTSRAQLTQNLTMVYNTDSASLPLPSRKSPDAGIPSSTSHLNQANARLLALVQHDTDQPSTSRGAEASGSAEASELCPPSTRPKSGNDISKMTRDTPPITGPLQFTEEQKGEINSCEPKHLMRLLSCTTRLPVLFITCEGKTIYQNGEAEKIEEKNLNKFPNAIIISKQQNNVQVNIKQSGQKEINNILDFFDVVTLLKTIPTELYRATSSNTLYKTFISHPDNLQESGVKHYSDFNSLFKEKNYDNIKNQLNIEAKLKIKDKLNATNLFFNELPGNEIAKIEFFLALLLDIEFTLLPAEKRIIQKNKNENKTSLGAIAAAATRERVTPTQVHFIASKIEDPPPWAFSAMTAMVIQDKSDSDALANYLYIIAKKPSHNKNHEFNSAFNIVMKAFKNDNPNAILYVMQEMVKQVYHELEEKPLENKETQNRLQYYFSLFMQAADGYIPYIQKSEKTITDRDIGYERFVRKAFWPLITLCEDGFKNHFSKIREWISFNSPNSETYIIEDRAMSVIITAAFEQPPAWSEAIARQVEKILPLGLDGNRPLATIYFIAFCYERLPREYSEEMFHTFFGVNIKKDDQINAIVMLLLIDVYQPDKVLDLYTEKKETVINILFNYLKKIKPFQTKTLDAEECLVIGKAGASIEEYQKWEKHVEEGKREPLVLPENKANPFVQKFNFLVNAIFTQQHTTEIVASILKSLSSTADRDIIKEIAIANINSKGFNLYQTANRFQEMLKDTLSAINKNMLTTEEIRKNQCSNLIGWVLFLQLNLVKEGNHSITNNLTEIISDNFSKITKPADISKSVKILEDIFNINKISENLYVTITTSTLAKSFNRKLEAKTGSIIRTMTLNSALHTIKNRDKLFSALAVINNNLTSEESGYNAFMYIIQREMGYSLTPKDPPPVLNNQERQALITLITSNPVGWDIFERAYMKMKENSATAGININTKWIINPPCFLQLTSATKNLMMKFISVLNENPANFILQCLRNIEQQLTEKVSSVEGLEHMLKNLCNYLLKEQFSLLVARSANTTENIVERIFAVADKINNEKSIQCLHRSLQEALITLISNVEQADSQLAVTYHSLITIKPEEVHCLPVNNTFPSNRLINEKASDHYLLPLSDRPAAETAAEKAPMIICIGKEWHNAMLDSTYSITLPEATESLLSGDFKRVNFHRYTDSQVFFSFDVGVGKSVQGFKGRGPGRAWVFKGSGNYWFFGGVGSHKDALAAYARSQQYSEDRVNELISNTETLDQELYYNTKTGELTFEKRTKS